MRLSTTCTSTSVKSMSTESRWTVVYPEGVRYSGATAAEWASLPRVGYQYVIEWAVPATPSWGLPGCPLVEDRKIWTGDDFVDPFGYGIPLEGLQLSDEEYHGMAESVFYGSRESLCLP
jgi:hypothetical protein